MIDVDPRWVTSHASVVAGPAGDSEIYAEKFREAFGVDAPAPVEWGYVPPLVSPADRLDIMRAIWLVEIKYWRVLLTKLHREAVPGALIEFGVSTGKSLELIVGICEELGWNPPTYGLDSFEGLPVPSVDDPLDKNWKQGAYRADFAAVQRRLKIDQRPHVRLCKGWFSDTLPRMGSEIGTVAFARIDCDLYEPTVECLHFLRGRFSHGAILYFDDWLHQRMQGETKAFFEFFETARADYRFEYLAAFCVGSLAVRVWHRSAPVPSEG